MKMRMLLLWLLLAVPGWAESAAFEEAAKLYEAQDFAGARQHYEQVLSAGQISANVFYNLGNTEFRLSRPGYAALAYQRALLLEPRHHEAAVNLALLRSQSGAKRLPEPLWQVLLLPLSTSLYFTLAAAAFWLAVLSGAALLLWRRTPQWFIFVCVLSFLVAGYAAVALWQTSRERTVAVVLVPEATARLEAADRSGVAETLPAGSDVRVLSEHGAWFYCELPGRGRGWLPQKSIERVSPSA